MQGAGEDRGGEDVVAEDLSPFGEPGVAGDDHAAAFVAAGDELEQHVRLSPVQQEVLTSSTTRTAGRS